MSFIQPLNANIATPQANGFAYLLDSTRWGGSISGTLQPSASLSSPGGDTGWMTMRQLVGSVNPVAQAVTLKFYTLSAGAWVHQTALDVSCPAGQPTAIEFSPAAYGATDGMVAMQAGATAPTSISGIGTVSDVSSESIADTLLTTVGDTLVKTAAGFARMPAPAVGSVKTGSATDPNGQADLALGSMATQSASAVAITGGTSTDVLLSDTVTSGALVVAGAAVGPAPTTQKWSAASAASASSPGICGGVAVAAVGATDLALKVQSVGITGVIADALWDSLPATSDVDKPVYLSKTAGKYTLDVSAFTTTDRVQSLGILHAGGTGACRIKLAIGKGLTAAQSAALVPLASTLLPPCANNFDPTVTGQVAAIGAIVGTLDLTKCWQKWGAGNTQWAPLHPISSSFGAACSLWDTTSLVADLACDTLGGVEVLFQGTINAGPVDVWVRLNGATANLRRQFLSFTNTLGAPGVQDTSNVITDMKAGGRFNLRLSCKMCRSGNFIQTIEYNVNWHIYINAPNDGLVSEFGTLIVLDAPPQSEIHSLGIATNGTGALDATCTATIRRI